VLSTVRLERSLADSHVSARHIAPVAFLFASTVPLLQYDHQSLLAIGAFQIQTAANLRLQTSSEVWNSKKELATAPHFYV
jgi:hypothetical protein